MNMDPKDLSDIMKLEILSLLVTFYWGHVDYKIVLGFLFVNEFEKYPGHPGRGISDSLVILQS